MSNFGAKMPFGVLVADGAASLSETQGRSPEHLFSPGRGFGRWRRRTGSWKGCRDRRGRPSLMDGWARPRGPRIRGSSFPGSPRSLHRQPSPRRWLCALSHIREDISGNKNLLLLHLGGSLGGAAPTAAGLRCRLKICGPETPWPAVLPQASFLLQRSPSSGPSPPRARILIFPLDARLDTEPAGLSAGQEPGPALGDDVTTARVCPRCDCFLSLWFAQSRFSSSQL